MYLKGGKDSCYRVERRILGNSQRISKGLKEGIVIMFGGSHMSVCVCVCLCVCVCVLVGTGGR